MKIASILLGATVLLLSSPFVRGQSTPSSEGVSVQSKEAPVRTGEPVQLEFWNRPITVFRSYYNQMSPAERAAKAHERLAGLPDVAEWSIAANPTTIGQYSGMFVTVNDLFIFSILNDDLDPESHQTLQAATDRATAQLRTALEARTQQRRLPVFIRAAGLSALATLILFVALWLVMLFYHRVRTRLDQAAAVRARRLKLAGLSLEPLIGTLSRALAKLTAWAAVVTLIDIWLTFVLLQFPYTNPWGNQLGTFLRNLFARLGTGMLHSIPGMFTVVVIFLLTRIVTRVVSGFFIEVEKGNIAMPWLHRDTARATRHLVVALVWVFAVTVAYPYIPGSNTEAFKGVSVLLGLMVSLGSAGLINQIMSGLVIVYSRALKSGEFVRIGDDVGTVTDVSMLSTKILTRKREEITIPNAVLVGAKTVNYSRHAAGLGVRAGTTVTIGYDAPWRLVHAMLLRAAEQTAGVRKEPPPHVLQRALSSFYVEYELVVTLDRPEERAPVLSEMHMHIQDAFNEQGVQIMSPHYESQPDERVFVPKSKWFPKPADTSTNEPPTRQSAD